MPRFAHRFVVKAPLKRVRSFHHGPEVLKKLSPPPMLVQVHEFGALADGMVAEFTLWLGPIPIRWRALHSEVTNAGFVDAIDNDLMARWVHRHSFVDLGDDRTEVRDEIDYQHQSGLKGIATRLLFNKAALKGLFRYRAWVTRRGCE